MGGQLEPLVRQHLRLNLSSRASPPLNLIAQLESLLTRSGLTPGITGEQSRPRIRGPLIASPVHPLVRRWSRRHSTIEVFLE